MRHKIRYRHKTLTTICAVTEAIKDEATSTEAGESSILDEIWRLAETAQLMGQAMEDGLDDKRTQIESLEGEIDMLVEQVDMLTSENQSYWSQIEQLEDELAGL